ncbi:MAG TPA: peptide chain release factor N(5)-glutamine methyltransferase [Candidatus Saccharimonadales bacterium]
MTIDSWIHTATQLLKTSGILTARLDAEIILAHTIKKSRTYLHAHGDTPLDERTQEIANARIDLRRDRTPVAYIVGHKEFYGRLFKVTPATLIPRPESETIITLLTELFPAGVAFLQTTPKYLIDIGTGSGCLGITAKLEFPELEVTLSDISRHALQVAAKNASELHAEVTLQQGDLLDGYPFDPDIIIANLPYVDTSWERSPETASEPAEALFADDGGLALIKKLIDQAVSRMHSGGLIFLEADPRQHSAIISYAKKHGFALRERRDFIVVIEKL